MDISRLQREKNVMRKMQLKRTDLKIDIGIISSSLNFDYFENLFRTKKHFVLCIDMKTRRRVRVFASS